MRSSACSALMVLMLAFGGTALSAQALDLPATAASDPDVLDASIPTLAERAAAVYEDADPVRHLGTLARLRAASGHHAKALATLDSLRRLPEAPGPSGDPGRVALEIHASAMKRAAGEGEAFDVAYRNAFREVVGRLDGIEALDVTWYLQTPGFVFENRLRAALEGLDDGEELTVADAVALVRAHLDHRVHTDAEPLLAA